MAHLGLMVFGTRAVLTTSPLPVSISLGARLGERILGEMVVRFRWHLVQELLDQLSCHVTVLLIDRALLTLIIDTFVVTIFLIWFSIEFLTLIHSLCSWLINKVPIELSSFILVLGCSISIQRFSSSCLWRPWILSTLLCILRAPSDEWISWCFAIRSRLVWSAYTRFMSTWSVLTAWSMTALASISSIFIMPIMLLHGFKLLIFLIPMSSECSLLLQFMVLKVFRESTMVSRIGLLIVSLIQLLPFISVISWSVIMNRSISGMTSWLATLSSLVIKVPVLLPILSAIIFSILSSILLRETSGVRAFSISLLLVSIGSDLLFWQWLSVLMLVIYNILVMVSTVLFFSVFSLLVLEVIMSLWCKFWVVLITHKSFIWLWLGLTRWAKGWRP